MAFSVGGEYIGVVAYLLEGARPGRRGLITSLAAANEVGALLAVGVCAGLVYALPTSSVETWGWRLPFLLGAALAGGVGLARSTMQKSPDFARQQAAGTVPAAPLRHTLRHHRPAIERTFAISALGSITYYVGITYVPTFLTTTARREEGQALGWSTLAAVVVILVTPFFGLLSDRLGRKPVLAGASALLPILLFSLMRGSPPAGRVRGPAAGRDGRRRQRRRGGGHGHLWGADALPGGVAHRPHGLAARARGDDCRSCAAGAAGAAGAAHHARNGFPGPTTAKPGNPSGASPPLVMTHY